MYADDSISDCVLWIFYIKFFFIKIYASARRLKVTAKYMGKRRLTGAVFSEQGVDFPRLEVQRHPGEHRFVGIFYADIFKFKHTIKYGLPRRPSGSSQ